DATTGEEQGISARPQEPGSTAQAWTQAEPGELRGTRMSEPESDPRCILVLPDRNTARALAALLTDRDYPSEVVTPGLTTITDPLTGAVEAAAPEFQVWVTNPEHAAAAKQLIHDKGAEIEAVREREAKRAARTGTVTAVCE